MSDIDKAIEEMILGDLIGAKKMAPIDYAKSRGMFPQKVYKALRDKRLEATHCECGRRVIDVDDADTLFKLKAVQAEEEVSGGDLDADDEER